MFQQALQSAGTCKGFLEENSLYPMHYPGMFVFQIHKSFCCYSSLFIPLDFLSNSSKPLFQILPTLPKELRSSPPPEMTCTTNVLRMSRPQLMSPLSQFCLHHHLVFAFSFILSTYFQRSHILSLFPKLTFSGILDLISSPSPPPSPSFWHLQVHVLF